jgi:hypothetical protein
MTKFLMLLPILSVVLTSCGAKEVSSGSDTLTPRFNPGTFALIKCKDELGRDGLALDMVIQAETLTEMRVRQDKVVLNTFKFEGVKIRETDEGPMPEVKLSKEQGKPTAIAFWSLEQGFLVIQERNKDDLNGISCTMSNVRLWESMTGIEQD